MSRIQTWCIGLSLAAVAAGSAYALESQRPNPDTDGQGILTRSEAEARSARLFARMDANQDGKLDAADRAARKTARFDRLDTDKDGQLSRDEFTAPRARPAMGADGEHRMGPRPAMTPRKAADANGDRAITQAEFTAAALRRFDLADADKDGRVTLEERRAMRAQMRRNRGAPPAPPAG